VPPVVETIEYDPNRSSTNSPLNTKGRGSEGILLRLGAECGEQVLSGRGVEIKTGNALRSQRYPSVRFVHI